MLIKTNMPPGRPEKLLKKKIPNYLTVHIDQNGVIVPMV